jgi:ferredoxin-NADP reductase
MKAADSGGSVWPRRPAQPSPATRLTKISAFSFKMLQHSVLVSICMFAACTESLLTSFHSDNYTFYHSRMSFMLSGMPWHEGEEMIHKLTKVEKQENPNSPYLTPAAAYMLQRSPLLALGTVDKSGRPWATLWGGEAPLAQPVAHSIIGIRTIVDSKTDPVVDLLYGGRDDGEVIKEQGAGRMISGLTIDLERRKRVKLYGRMVARALGRIGPDNDGASAISVGEVQLVVKIEQSLNNCPKYLNCKRIYPVLPEPALTSDSTHLPPEAVDLIAKADTFFISSCDHDKDMDMNIRGGPPGFVRVQSNDDSSTVLVWPEYSGNNLYQTLGNLQTSPKAGLVFPDFETGNVLYVTGDTETLLGKEAGAVLPRSSLAVRLTLTGARFVQKGLPFRGETLERSPYNPNVRFLASEKPLPEAQKTADNSVMAKLVKKEKLTPTIHRYRFSISDPLAAGPWKPGQYVALSFQDELDMGYSHMRDDDPRSLNDDYLRTFTVSSRPGKGLHGEEFEIMVRNVGNVTRYMSMQSERSGLEVPLRGFGGEFRLQQTTDATIAFIAGGIGITPLLAQLEDLDISRLQLFWSLHVRDVGLVYDTFKRHPTLPKLTTLYMSGQLSDIREEDASKWDDIRNPSRTIEQRRLKADDLKSLDIETWYLCTGVGLRTEIFGWLAGKTMHYEDFHY